LAKGFDQGVYVSVRQQMLHCRYQGSVAQQSCKALQAAAAAAAAAGITCWQEAADATLQIPGECYPAVLHSPAGSSSSRAWQQHMAVANAVRSRQQMVHQQQPFFAAVNSAGS
jgi:hypothetical protein